MIRKQQLFDIEARIADLESKKPLEPLQFAVECNQKEIESFQASVQALTEKVKNLTLATAEGIENVARKERRIGATLARARKDLKKLGFEDAGLEAEATELQPVNGTGGEEQGLPAVRDAVAEVASQASSIKGVPLETLQRYRGLI